MIQLYNDSAMPSPLKAALVLSLGDKQSHTLQRPSHSLFHEASGMTHSEISGKLPGQAWGTRVSFPSGFLSVYAQQWDC